MSITVRFFASLRERLGRSEMAVELEPNDTVRRIWVRATADQPLPDNILKAVNQEYAHDNTSVKDGDEVAFFPPVTGGSGEG